PGPGIGHRHFQRLQVDRLAHDRDRPDPCRLVRLDTAAHRRDEGDFIVVSGPEVGIDIFAIDCEGDPVVDSGQRRKFLAQLAPDLPDGDPVGELADQLGGTGAFAQRGEESERKPAHRLSRWARWPSSGSSSFSSASRHAAGDPGSAAMILPALIPATARLIIAADPISLYDSIRKSSPNPSSSLSRSGRTASIVVSRG